MGLFDVFNNKDATEKTPLKEPEGQGGVSEKIRRQSQEAIQMVKEGRFTLHVFAFLGGIALVISSIIDTVESFINNDAAEVMISFYTLCLGCLIIVVDGSRKISFPKAWMYKIKFYFRIVDYAWGRGCLYCLAGSLQFTIQNVVNSCVGAYMVLIGALAILSSFGAGLKLAELHAEIDNMRDLKSCFSRFDIDSNGSLNSKEFALLMYDLSVDCTYYELEGCFNAIDKNDDERISYDEFKEWWTGWGKKHLQRNSSHNFTAILV
mmetsp:Transcript_22179/g.32740  ORF Transcript_22179/g.32740 Transcript_22179/m.32740 type:complete len:264 (+) Transcript_22179:98-889(+)|eukprot:CAMPEP_0194213726 /NCGR_PEP_ID=MMETSP0156-20130528/14517_1 /TAXON_ID=33649 /ORGANISM="Thalassionema nitzschioides, Strain L26-B" /LENGTH=263 /DNA_ID=CAMNT_0038941823 /DNA_START=63 /DNA_END=854 /DNA_ORIENTATION=-